MVVPAYLSVAAAALRACVSESTIYEACKARQLVHYRPGVNGRGKILILVEDLDAWMAAFKVEVVPGAGVRKGKASPAPSHPPLKHIKLA